MPAQPAKRLKDAGELEVVAVLNAVDARCGRAGRGLQDVCCIAVSRVGLGVRVSGIEIEREGERCCFGQASFRL